MSVRRMVLQEYEACMNRKRSHDEFLHLHADVAVFVSCVT
jgi:hypothetical protein